MGHGRADGRRVRHRSCRDFRRGAHHARPGHPAEIDRAFSVPGLLLEAWVAERREDDAAAVTSYRAALELAGRVGFGDHAAFALSGLGAIALARGDLREAEHLERQAVATAEAAAAPWAAAHARVQLARIAAAAGKAEVAEGLYRQVIDWAQAERPHEARESLFLALAGSPAAAARLGLAELALT